MNYNFDEFENLFIKLKEFEIEFLSNPKNNFFSIEISELKNDFHLLKSEIHLEDYTDLIDKILKKKETILIQTKLNHSGNHLKIELKKTKNRYFGYFQLTKNEMSNLSYLSHEIRVPIQSIVGSISLLKLEQGFTKEQKEIIHSLKNSSNHLLNLLNDVLEFSKIESGKLELNKIDFYLKDLLENLVQNFKFLAEQKNIFFEVVLSTGLEHLIYFDKQRLNQVLMNLINNSIKFTELGFVRLEVKLISKLNSVSKVMFSVKDSGIGIPKDKLEEIFESFSQVKRAVETKIEGTGLGLSIVKQILKLMNSQIQVKSEMGLGSNFYFELDIPNSKNNFVEEKNIVLIKKDFAGKKVLLVEDNLQNQIIAKKLLAKLNLKVELAENGQMALEKVKSQKFDLILMDIQLPVMDGFEASSSIRKLESEIINPTPIIALTATALEDTKKLVLKSGMNDYLPKPFTFEALSEKISDYLP